tara:strand:+ start:754 stop:1296 length:543 start_codon:yes stop_codon:yes gene_type:complete
MHVIVALLLALLVPASYLFGENVEKSKKLLFSQKIDNQNEKLGESLDPEIRLKLIKFQNELNTKSFMVFSGFEYLENNIEGDLVKFVYRAHADSSYYSEEQIKEVKDFLINDRILLCKFKEFRELLFLLNPQYELSVVDKLNKPFINFRFNKESCREVEPFGRDRALKQRDVNRLIKKLN